jgi:hypothetical protein
MTLRVGDIVKSVRVVSQDNFMGKRRHVHARPGDIGEVLDVMPGGQVNVLWKRSGTKSVASPDDLQPR